jgi:hypothetical protein
VLGNSDCAQTLINWRAAHASTYRFVAGAACQENYGSFNQGQFLSGAYYADDTTDWAFCTYPDDSYQPHSAVANIWVDTWIPANSTVYATACVNANSSDGTDVICSNVASFYRDTDGWANPGVLNTVWYMHPPTDGWYAYVFVTMPHSGYLNGVAMFGF